ncbi:hypothetical protein NP233_g1651 [Leucocoprinus birnbaumii]|uniref:SGTA homodimerisation domain-containing protein n=1 Tax=Leucocoprinus birnbaumii TaxID=56174 RepID=A0AAD5W0J0_9AGAR|nr:hypothetical protein NP233_g1651 [Leucocoprinus birnbaumii]
MSEKQQRLVLAIIDFLNQSIDDGTVKSEDKESLDVAIQCIGESFGVDPSDQEQVEKLSVKPTTLQSIFDVYMKTRDKVGARTPASADASSSSAPKVTTAEDKALADKHKQEGNALMTSKKYDQAIEAYTNAINLDSSNPVYYSNRAAAHSSKGDHLSAIGDAETAITVDPKFSKGYHRLGRYSLGDFKAAADAFERGLQIDPNNVGLKSSLASAKSKLGTESEVSPRSTPAPDASAGAGAAGGMGGLADMFRGMGGMGGGAGGGAGGMPDLASLMNNPAIMSMAQQMAQNGGLERLMQNPAVANMMNRAQSGQMPSMDELMSNPELRNLASQFGGGTGGPGAGR